MIFVKRVWARTQLTALHVTHSNQEAKALADRSLILKEGSIVEADEIAKPRNPGIRKSSGSDPYFDNSCRSESFCGAHQ